MLDRKDFDQATKVLSEQELSNVIKAMEPYLIDGVKDENSPYHVRKLDSPDYGSETHVDLCFGNASLILQDLVITPIANSLVELLEVKEANIPETQMHGIQQFRFGFSIYDPTGLERSLLSAAIDAPKIAQKLLPIVNSVFDEGNFDKDYTFLTASEAGKFIGINLDSLVWKEVGFQVENLATKFLREKYKGFSDCSYFDRDFQPIFRPKFDAFTGCGIKYAEPIFGTRTVLDGAYERRNAHEELHMLFDKKTEGALSAIVDYVAPLIQAKLSDRGIEKPAEDAEFRKRFDYEKNVSQVYSELFEAEREGYQAWMKGVFFSEEGAYVTPLNRTVLASTDITLSTDTFPDSHMRPFAEGMWSSLGEYLPILSEHDSFVAMLKHRGTGYGGFIVKDRHNPLIPNVAFDGNAFAEFAGEIVPEKVIQRLSGLDT